MNVFNQLSDVFSNVLQDCVELGSTDHKTTALNLPQFQVCRHDRAKLGDSSVFIPNQLVDKVTQAESRVNEALQEKTDAISTPVTGMHIAKNAVYVQLDRSKSMKRVIAKVLKVQPSPVDSEKPILICRELSEKDGDVSDLRVNTVVEHLTQLLCFAGLSVVHEQDVSSSGDAQQMSVACGGVYDTLEKSSHCIRQPDGSLALDLQHFKSQPGAKHLRGMQTVWAGTREEPSRVFQKVASLLNTLSASTTQTTCTCVHVTRHAREQLTMSSAVTCAVLANERDTTHLVLTVGDVTLDGKSGVSVTDFYRSREEDVRAAHECKHGGSGEGGVWSDHVTHLTQAAVRFDLLSSSHASKVSLKTEGCSGRGGGVFVVYNYARLATLLQKFDRMVAEGTYPALPELENVDFSQLKDDEGAWVLVLHHLAAWPGLVQQVVTPVVNFQHSLPAKLTLNTHTICNFLSDLSRDVSHYYSRTHVLKENYPHLLPAMFARLHLLHAVKVVMETGFSLLGIQPVDVM